MTIGRKERREEGGNEEGREMDRRKDKDNEDQQWMPTVTKSNNKQMGSAPVLQIHFPHSYVLFFFYNPNPVKFDIPWVSGKAIYKRGKTHDPSNRHSAWQGLQGVLLLLNAAPHGKINALCSNLPNSRPKRRLQDTRGSQPPFAMTERGPACVGRMTPSRWPV